MTGNQALEFIHSRARFGVRPGLERIKKLCAMLGDPQDAPGMKYIHVAGTNGKGSVCKMIAEILRAAGYKTGLYTSPYLESFGERMQIDSRNISLPELAELVGEVKPLVKKLDRRGGTLTEFEVVTACAFLWFKRQNCDIVVLETGLGGRFDATNIIKKPLVTVLSAISLDHTDILGGTLAKIAFEKCGIIKPGTTVITPAAQPVPALEVIMRTCCERQARVINVYPQSVEILERGRDFTQFKYGLIEVALPLAGKHQIENAVMAIEAASLLNQRWFVVRNDSIVKGLKAAKFPARLELISKQPAVLLDGAHNRGSMAALAGYLKRFFAGVPVTAIIGMMKDKDCASVLSIIAPLCKNIITVAPDNPRAASSMELAELAEKFCPDVTAADSTGEALWFASSCAAPDGLLLICGSLYLAGQLRPLLKNTYRLT